MIDLFGEQNLALLTGDSDVIVDAKLNAAMNAAEAEVNGFLQGTVALPLASVPEVLAVHACNIAYWYLDPDNPTDGARERYRAALRFLERVQDGKAGLGLDGEGTAVLPAGGVTVSAPDRVFSNCLSQLDRGFRAVTNHVSNRAKPRVALHEAASFPKPSLARSAPQRVTCALARRGSSAG